MSQNDQHQDSPQELSGLTESVRLPMDYFILPLWLSFPTPCSVLFFAIGTIAAITDPICPQWLWAEYGWVDWVGITIRIILLVSFAGMCCRKEWALWLTATIQIICTLWIWLVLGTSGFRQDGGFLFMTSVYGILIASTCFYALGNVRSSKRNDK